MIFSPLLRWAQRTSLVAQIALALVAGVALAILLPGVTPYVAFLGTLFISALKAVAPVLVLVLVMAAISNHVPGEATGIRPILALYVIGTLAAAVVGVAASMLWPSTLTLMAAPQANAAPPGAVGEVLLNVAKSAVDNPVNALLQANYIGVLAWAVGLG
ncbi:cation:dicarboxylate symporter family transporter, partial [Pulveribacter sp.]